ncbi:MAG: hypothetical protein ACRC2O_03145 [Chitinophagaceae bacterium]
MKKMIIFSVLIFLASNHINAQTRQILRPTYKTAIGLRPYPFGITVKTNLDTRRASLEFIGYFKDGFVVLGLYEWYFDLNHTRNLSFYFGGGGLAGFKNENSGGGAVLGVSGVIGLDYKFLKIPLNLSLDWQPSYQIGRIDEMKNFGGLAIRFAF